MSIGIFCIEGAGVPTMVLAKILGKVNNRGLQRYNIVWKKVSG